MKNTIKRVFKFLKTYPGIFYSLFLIIFLPLLLYFHTFYLTSNFQKNIDSILHSKALSIENTFSIFARDFFSKPEVLQSKIKELIKENPEIKKLRLIGKEGEKFRILASNKEREVGAEIENLSLVLSWSQNQVIATQVSENGRAWKVVSPIYTKEGEKIGLISLSLSLKKIDEVISKSVFNAFLITILGIVITLILIFHHTNLLGYVSLTKKLQQLDKAKDEFIRMATHELQSPVVNIRGYILELKESLSDRLSSEEKEFLERIEISAKNLSNLISDILEVSRIEQGRLDFTPEVLDPKKELREIAKEFEIQAKEKGLKFLYEETPETVSLFINPLRFREVISNLLNNAIKYTFEGYVKIESKVDYSRKRYYISVIDTGIGISAEAQRKLFQKFFREKRRETAGIQGTGLGLWIVKEIIQRMGGDIFVESIQGQGSRFTVYFPLHFKR
jgi:signal transduction histidine kinase